MRKLLLEGVITETGDYENLGGITFCWAVAGRPRVFIHRAKAFLYRN